MDVTMRKIFPSFNEVRDTTITMETINYEYSEYIDEYGDREVIDVSREYIITVKVPKITFLDWLETLISLKSNGISTIHIYTKDFKAYKPVHSPVWDYFDEVNGNLLSNGFKFRSEDMVMIYVFWLKDFDYYVILRLLSHQEALYSFVSLEQ